MLALHRARLDRRGFTLIEALVALSILSLVLLLGYGFLMRQPRALERLAAGDDALRALEASLETLRAGVIDLDEGMLQPVVAYPPPTHADEMIVDLEAVEPTDTEGVWSVTLEARYRVGNAIQTRRLQSLVWRPQ